MRAILAAAVVLMTACVTQRPIDDATGRYALTPEHFARTASIKDDDIDTVAVISTLPGYQEKRGLLGIVWDDNFLRAFIDKRTGATTFQLYQVIFYEEPSWAYYQTISYETPAGPVSKPVTAVKRDVRCTGNRYSNCTFEEHVTVAIDEPTLRAIAARYQPGTKSTWRLKFGAKSGTDYRDAMSSAEVAGLVSAVDAYRVRLSSANR